MSSRDLPGKSAEKPAASASPPWEANVRRSRWRRVPIVLQATMTECGAACLAMILSYWGRNVRISECRDMFGAGRDGIRAKALVAAARSFGLRAKAFSVELDHFYKIALPAIIHWKFHHFVVVERWSPGGVEIVDPAQGRRTVDREEFSKNFTGVALTFEPGPSFRAGGSRPSPWAIILRRLLSAPGMKGALGQVLLASLAAQVLALGLPLLVKVLVDRVLPLGRADVLPVVGAAIVVFVLAQAFVGYLRSALLIHAQGRFDERLVLGLFEHMVSLPFRFFQQRTIGDLLTRLGSGAMLRELFTSQTLSMMLDGVLVVVYLGVLFWMAPPFGALTLGLGLAQALLVLGTARRMRDLSQQHLAADTESQGFAVQALKGMAILKAQASEGLAVDYWSNLFYRQLNVSLRKSYLSALVNAGLSALRILAPLALLWMGAREVLAGAMTLGTMLALNAVAAGFFAPLSSLLSTSQQFQVAGAHLSRIADLLDMAPEPTSGGKGATTLKGEIELRNVSFRYEPSGPWVLENVSMTVEPGQKVAIVGKSGSGKSTLGLLLLGLQTPSGGDILFDGTSVRDLDLRKVRSQFGVVLQEPFLFGGTIRENIVLNNPTIPFERVTEAARLSALEDEIEAMPMGYETWLGEGGAGLSGGQRQRLSLARALSAQPPILLLDEATSHLDVTTEACVEKNLSALACTRIVIAHRLSTIRNADLILVLDGGKVVEQGTHEALIEMGGMYAALVQGQEEPRSSSPSGPPLSDRVAPPRLSAEARH